MVAHDLKAPLNGIAALVEFLVEDYGERLDDEGRDQLRLIRTMATRSVTMVDALRQLARLSTAPISPRRVDMAAAATRAAALVRGRWPGLALDLTVDPAAPAAVIDPAQAPVLLDHLFTNAVLFHDRAERHVSFGPADALAPDMPAGHVAYAVRDDGLGIPARHRAVVFDMFKRLHGSDKFGGGVGAGLALARVIVDRHGGRIWADGGPDTDRGTTIVFTLPAAPAEPTA